MQTLFFRYFHASCLMLSMLFLAPAVAAQQSPGIESMMTDADKVATGLGSLSDSELEALNRWLQDRNMLPARQREPVEAGEVPAVTASEADIGESAEPARVWGEREVSADVVSMIEGEFDGWDGKTVFTLANGQVYQQRRPGRWKTSLVNPEVRVTKGVFGFDLEIDGHSIGVRRLR